MKIEELLSSTRTIEVPSADDLSARPPGIICTINAEFRAQRWDPTYALDWNMFVCLNNPVVGGTAILAFPNQIVMVASLTGCNAQDRLMPCSGFDIGLVDPWSAGNVTCGYALAKANAGDTIPMLFQHIPIAD